MSPSRSSSPPPKRARLDHLHERSPSVQLVSNSKETEEDIPDDLDQDHCCICLQKVVDRTVIPVCSHEFCFDCLMIWCEQSRRCPLCSQNIGDHVIHSIRSRYDYQKHFLLPLRSTSPPLLPPANRPLPPRNSRPRRIPREVRERIRREREEKEEADRFEQALEKRRWIYKHDLYAKHVASNAYTRFRPYPTPAQFAASPDLISRTTSFLRRELQVWMDLDVEFLTTFIISLMKAIDIRSESAIKLLSEFLDMDAPYVEGGRHVNAEHFAHEIYTYVRSPYKDLFIYDTVVQYDSPPDLSPPRSSRPNRGRRWRDTSRPRIHSRSRSHSQSRSRSPTCRSSPRGRQRRGRRESRSRIRRSVSVSWSPSGRQYPDTNAREKEVNEHTSSSSWSLRDGTHGSVRSHQPNPVTPVLSQQIDDCTHVNHGLRASAVREQSQMESEGRTSGDAPVGSSSTSKSIKGKERAIDRPANENRTPLTSDKAEKGSSHVGERPTSLASIGNHKKQPRFRSIIESVQAHLSSERNPDNTSPSSLHQSPPSLLSRLTDKAIGVESPAATSPNIETPSHVIDRRPSVISRETSVPRPNTRLVSSLPKETLSPLTVPSGGRHDTSISSRPDVDDFVHVRAAVTENVDRNPRASNSFGKRERTTGASFSGLTPEAESHRGRRRRGSESSVQEVPKSDSCTPKQGEGSHVGPVLAVSADDNGSNANSGLLTNSDTSERRTTFPFPSGSANTLRSLLSHKLEKEKLMAQVSHTSTLSAASSSDLTALTSVEVPPEVSGSKFESLDRDMTMLSSSSSSSTTSLDATAVAVEARLRVRAQLKARLAIEKRNFTTTGTAASR